MTALIQYLERRKTELETENRLFCECANQEKINAESGYSPLGAFAVARVAAMVFGVPEVDVMSRKGIQSVVMARHAAMLVYREMFRHATLDEIGKSFGGRNHVTVLRAIRTVKDRITVYPHYAAQIERMREILNFKR